ncbi:MAG: endonuclease domain-containing protein [Candidatus Doudnabacteria bacterium]|nr:endonuclease domain-containing protein [Candidatus Doudnabacteria bacterium]
METIQSIAKGLRSQQTPEEKKFWFLLQDRRLSGYKFRRQVWIDKYYVDFCCYKAKLIIELDGGYHNRASNKLYDLERTKYLESQGFRVIRFWNSDVNNHEKLVLEKIRERLFSPSSVPPLNQKTSKGGTSSPARGEEKRK